MRLIGLMTQNPRTYFEMLEALREQNIEFVALEPGESLPANVGAVITTPEERARIYFDRVVTDEQPDVAIAKARMMMASAGEVRNLMIGVDPGVKPGVAVLADGVVLTRYLADSPEAVSRIVGGVGEEYPEAEVVVRIGNGDRINRNRIFNALWEHGLRLEIVDERNTTPRSQTPDEDAAVEIAMTPGYSPRKKQEIDPCPGEVRNIQRISRLESRGSVTVSKDLARQVAKGELTLSDAIDKQKNGRSSKS
jgi:hypothetical protein